MYLGFLSVALGVTGNGNFMVSDVIKWKQVTVGY
jgi:hypothetical protein